MVEEKRRKERLERLEGLGKGEGRAASGLYEKKQPLFVFAAGARCQVREKIIER